MQKVKVLYVFVLVLAGTTIMSGQATRTWVSGVGDDANPCSRTAPCKTFAGAISKTAAGGEIDALDPGGYGAVTITKAITINGMGTFAAILSAATNAIVVNAGASDVVTIRGISINGAGSGLAGIRFIAGGALHVEETVISGLTGFGIDFEPTTGGNDLYVSDTKIRHTQGGIKVRPLGGPTSTATVERCELTDNATFGIRVEDNARAIVR